MRTSVPLLGAHVSIAGGFDRAIAAGESLGCTAIQIFTKSNRQWHAKPITEEEIQKFKEARKNSSIRFVLAHASYLINIGSPTKVIAHKSTLALEQELHRCEQLEIPALVFHPGSNLESNLETSLEQIIENINIILDKSTGVTQLLLETMAGQGSSIGYTFEQLAAIRDKITKKKLVGICVDTCHIFSAGYDFRTEATYTQMWKEFDTVIGLEHLKAIHLNDSQKGLGSRIDRHTNIGDGSLGIEAFRLIMNDPKLRHIPKILETPGQGHKKDLEILLSLIKK